VKIVDELLAADVPDEALGVWRPEKKIFGVPRPRVIDPVGRAWRLGALLIDRDGQLFATGSVTRAIVPKDFNSDKTIAGHERREIQRAAARGAFRPGESVNYGWRRVTADEAAQLVSPATLERYLCDRVALLL
jgi:hypothetical protein